MTDLGEGGRAMITEATGRYHAAMGELRDVPWRVGRSNPRNLYADTGGDWKGHPPIGVMDSPELAAEAVRAHNAGLEGGRPFLVPPEGGTFPVGQFGQQVTADGEPLKGTITFTPIGNPESP
jgi:hypothetical protein